MYIVHFNVDELNLTKCHTHFNYVSGHECIVMYALTVFVHSSFKAFFEPTSSTLITMSFVNWTVDITLCFASVGSISMDTSFKKARTAFLSRFKKIQRVHVNIKNM